MPLTGHVPEAMYARRITASRRCSPDHGYEAHGVPVEFVVAVDRDAKVVDLRGDAFYLPPGHVPSATKGSEFLQISPAEALNETVAAIQAAMQQK